MACENGAAPIARVRIDALPLGQGQIMSSEAVEPHNHDALGTRPIFATESQ